MREAGYVSGRTRDSAQVTAPPCRILHAFLQSLDRVLCHRRLGAPRLTWLDTQVILSNRIPRRRFMSALSPASCPRCGLPAAPGLMNCTLCNAMIDPPNLRRIGLWLAVAVEYVIVLLVLVTR